jgi:deoxycytidylate deaminase
MTSHENLLRVAYYAALLSPDKHTQVGALILDNTSLFIQAADCNRPPEGLSLNPEVFETPAKYEYIEHAERNALFRIGHAANHCIMVAPWGTCPECARAIIAHKISALICHKAAIMRDTPWRDKIQTGLHMLRSAGIDVSIVDKEVGMIGNLMNGKEWNP